MRSWLLIFFLGFSLNSLAQDKETEGIVFDKTSNERIAKVAIHNIRTGKIVYNNLKAEFKIAARAADVLIFSRDGYYNDTVKVPESHTIFVYLKPSATMLKQVNIKDTLETPLKRFLATRQDYNKAYGSAAFRDILSVGPGGAGISIDAIWNSISREGKNAARLQEVIERDYHEAEIDYRFNKTLVTNITGLKEPKLTDFMRKHRPTYYAVKNYDQYQFINMVTASFKRYQRNPVAFGLDSLGGASAPVTLGDKKAFKDTLKTERPVK
ncbi:peptidase associated/transthyretin-like domain-containing protein [Mucilaginibacter myungsuensis]|uniref:Carboxypeptidase-like regulatory domain-containing protein n=1 Tax=Mucilaginibacter myungsuensis TaxID=649104 RepID=A0A929L1T0_9SPHI|nr:hypothetical protein [Mucilaginibacter myungsuensis]MBE9664043.1 hypothetical protein [Mucilaginibacter myungsuensis]MDN3601222.1 hypothetical protein [Mucilaginibacter myungsuensis]